MARRSNGDPLPALDRVAYAGEILGAPVSIPAGPGLAGPVVGTIVDETLSLLRVRVPGRATAVAVPKHRLAGTIVLAGRELPLSGEPLRVRPEDRTKRLLAGGPRRYR